MAFHRRNGQRFTANVWPGFVDAMTALLLVLMFVLSIFMIVQFVLRETITGQETELHELSAEVARHEPDGKGVPVLLRHSLMMNATLLDFAYDPNFMHCLDALMLVDLKESPSRLLRKYMGKEGYERFIS